MALQSYGRAIVFCALAAVAGCAGRVYPELVDPATAEKELQETSYTGSPAR